MKSHEIVQEYLRKHSLPDTSQRITNIFIKIFSQNFFSNIFSKYFFPNFFVKIFLKIFSQDFFSKFFFQNFLSKFSSKLFQNLFRGFRTRNSEKKFCSWIFEEHLRNNIHEVSWNCSGIFEEIFITWYVTANYEHFPQNFFSEFFFQIFFSKFFVKIFLKIFSKFVSKVSHARHTRVSSSPRERHACWEHPTRDFSRDFINENFLSNFFANFFFPDFLSKFSSNFFRHLFRGFRTRDTRVLRAPHARHTRVTSTPRGIFLVIISMRIFFQIFFPNIFSKFFCQNFL